MESNSLLLHFVCLFVAVVVVFHFFDNSFLSRELRKRVTGCSGGSDFNREWLVDYLLTFRKSAVFVFVLMAACKC